MEKKSKGGRPRRIAGEELDQLTIRLSPKLKFGLELLARAQNRSLSQAVEWALQVGLNNFRVSSQGNSIADLLEDVWTHDHAFDRINALYLLAPSLLSFEDRAACELVERSHERQLTGMSGLLTKTAKALPGKDGRQKLADLQEMRESIFYNFVRSHWLLIRAIAAEEMTAGRSLNDTILVSLLGDRVVGADELASMQALTDVALGKIAKDALPQRIVELEKSFPWCSKS